jgi:hypothetical protein
LASSVADEDNVEQSPAIFFPAPSSPLSADPSSLSRSACPNSPEAARPSSCARIPAPDDELLAAFDDSFFITGDIRCSTPLPPARDVDFLQDFPPPTAPDNFDDEFRLWASYYAKSQASTDKLLKILRRNGKTSSLPKCVKTLFRNRLIDTLKKKTHVVTIFQKTDSRKKLVDGVPAATKQVEIGTYLHVGLLDGVMLSSAGINLQL